MRAHTLFGIGVSVFIFAGWFPVSARVPASPVTWGNWQRVGECGNVTFYISLSNYDGRNDPEAKLRFENKDSHRVHARLQAQLVSDQQETIERRDPNAVMNPGTSAEGGALAPTLDLGQVFRAAVNETSPHRIQRVIFSNIEVAQIDVAPPNASPSAYYSDFGDHPTTKCGPWQFAGALPQFISLTESCQEHLPQWTAACDDAVQAIVEAYNAAPDSEKPCILAWRQYQKCYEVYAFNADPVPRPNCTPPPACSGASQ